MEGFKQPISRVGPSARRAWSTVAAFAVTAAIALIAAVWIAASPGRPMPTPPPSMAIATSTGSPSVPPTARPSLATFAVLPPPGDSVPPSPTVSLAPTIPPTYPPGAFADRVSWRINLPGENGPLTMLLIDPAERITGAKVAPMRFSTHDFTGGVLPAVDNGAVDVYWRGSTCDGWVTLTLATNGTITISATPVDTACKPGRMMHGLELRFAGAVNVKDFRLVIGPEHRYPGDLIPQAVAFIDATHGQVAMENDLVAVAETMDGGATWRLTAIGDGRVEGMAVGGQATVLAVSCDPSQLDHCAPGVYRQASFRAPWTRLFALDPGGIAAWGTTIAVIEQAPTDDQGNRPPATGLRVSNDDGGTWARVPNPCPATQPILSSVAFGSRIEPLVACETANAGEDRVLLSLDDATGEWKLAAALPRLGIGTQLSTAPSISGDPNADLSGLVWAHDSALAVTTTSGTTWRELTDVADGAKRTAIAAQAWINGGGMALVYDEQRSAQVLLTSANGGRWTEVTSFRELPCCGG